MNGDLKSLCSLWAHLARNQRYRPFIDEIDIEIVERRVTNEGLAFLTQILPLIGKALDVFHSTTEWKSPPEFDQVEIIIQQEEDSRSKIYGAIKVPSLLRKAVENALRGEPSAVDCVRQLSYVFYKLEVGYEDAEISKFLDRFIETDRGLSDHLDRGNHFIDLLLVKMRKLIFRVLCNEDPRDIIPSHGTGATACRTANWDKHHKLRYYPKLDEYFPYADYFFYNFTHLSDEYSMLEEADISEPKARVCLVPKDSRGPRVISCEPAELMFIQQGLMRKLYRAIETNPLTRGHVNFSDQTINQQLARSASIDDGLATIDLSDASDRVSLDLVRSVFPPNWVEALEACRSEYTVLPTGIEIKLNKFAPMGSACCFPVEALVFWACAEAACHIHYGSNNSHSIYVYGDDIIVSSYFAEDAIHALESIGLLANRNKCYVKGPFRESCGGDYYLGVDVTPVRLRKALGLSGTMLESSADFCNNIVQKFGYTESQQILCFIEGLLGYQFPRSLLALPGTIRESPGASNDVFFRRRWNKNLQRWEHRVLGTAFESKNRRPPNWGELLRKQLSGGMIEQPGPYEHPLRIMEHHLEPGQYIDPHSSHTKWVWKWLG